MHREPDVGLDPGSPGSRPGPKAGAKPLRHPGIPDPSFLIINLFFIGVQFANIQNNTQWLILSSAPLSAPKMHTEIGKNKCFQDNLEKRHNEGDCTTRHGLIVGIIMMVAEV